MNTIALIFAAISGEQLLNAVIWVVVAGVVFKVAKVIIAIAAVVLLINALMTVAGRPFIRW